MRYLQMHVMCDHIECTASRSYLVLVTTTVDNALMADQLPGAWERNGRLTYCENHLTKESRGEV